MKIEQLVQKENNRQNIMKQEEDYKAERRQNDHVMLVARLTGIDIDYSPKDAGELPKNSQDWKSHWNDEPTGFQVEYQDETEVIKFWNNYVE